MKQSAEHGRPPGRALDPLPSEGPRCMIRRDVMHTRHRGPTPSSGMRPREPELVGLLQTAKQNHDGGKHVAQRERAPAPPHQSATPYLPPAPRCLCRTPVLRIGISGRFRIHANSSPGTASQTTLSRHLWGSRRLRRRSRAFEHPRRAKPHGTLWRDRSAAEPCFPPNRPPKI